MPDLMARLACAAAAGPFGGGSSDFDLNPDASARPGRVLKAAGVLIAVENGPDGPQVILTKRSARLKHHPGQVAFPGGRQDPGDTDSIDAALREATEEIALPRTAVEILGCLPDHETVTAYLMTPVVARVTAPFNARPEAGEVAEIFRVPLRYLSDPANFRVEGRRWQGGMRLYYTVPWGPYYIWGATARILRTLADRMAA